MATKENIQNLNELFAEEIEAAIRYLHLSVTVKGLDRLLVHKVLLEYMQKTLDHARSVADKIVHLGGIPSLDLKLNLPPQKTTATDAVRTALTFEQAGLAAYRDLLENIVDDVPLEEFVRAQVGLESQHVAELSLLLEE